MGGGGGGNLRHGNGKMTYADGSIYDGQWQDDNVVKTQSLEQQFGKPIQTPMQRSSATEFQQPSVQDSKEKKLQERRNNKLLSKQAKAVQKSHAVPHTVTSQNVRLHPATQYP